MGDISRQNSGSPVIATNRFIFTIWISQITALSKTVRFGTLSATSCGDRSLWQNVSCVIVAFKTEVASTRRRDKLQFQVAFCVMANSCSNLTPLPYRKDRTGPREEPLRLQQTFPSRWGMAGEDKGLRFSTFKGLKARVFSLKKSTAAAFPVSLRHQIWNRKQYFYRRKCCFRIGNSSKHFKSRKKTES